MKNTLINVLYLTVGVGLGYLLFYLNKCDSPSYITKTEIVTDTITHKIKVEVPRYTTKYITRTDSIYKNILDTIQKWSYIQIPDTGKIEINQYSDSIKTDDYRLDYKIETLGHLVSFDPTLTIYKSYEPVIKAKPKNWMVSGAISNKLNYKIGAGYKGFTLEGEFGKRFNQVYIGKQITF